MGLKEDIRQIIIDSQNAIADERFFARELEVSRIPRKATVITGMRRTGKSIYERLYMQDLLAQGVKKELICPLDFSDDRLFPLRTGEPAVVAEAYYGLYPLAHAEKVYFFFDELQYLNHWELFVNRLQTTEKCEVNITGSSAKLLVKEIASEFGGRSLNWELFPFSFAEFVRARQQAAGQPFDVQRMTTMQRDLCRQWFAEYCAVGGLPESLLIDDGRARTVLFQNIADTVVYRDVIRRYNLSNPNEVSRLQQLLFGNMAKPVTFSKLQQRLSGEQLKMSKEMVRQAVGYFEDAYVFFTVEILSPNAAVRSTNPRKLYCADHALALASGTSLTADRGLMLENIVFLQLRRRNPQEEIHYYKTASGREIDFAVGKLGNVRLVQVCYGLEDAATEARELDALTEAMAELGVHTGLVITNDTEAVRETGAGTVTLVPAWKWLLS